MAADAHRSVSLTRTGPLSFEATNPRGGRISMSSGESSEFTPVELLLAAVAGCSGVDVDALTTRLAGPESFEIQVSGEKLRDGDGNHMGPITVRFQVTFPDGEAGDAARERLPEAARMSRDRLCTVSRTVQLPTEVRFEVGDQ
ncbi:OsmC family protein [Ornithinimicrobium tianjinense]|uniref:Osmotically inducible protein C n=1 Tax=Ornithinimicrobium tianjinense TaxID=1195761 RepID=A0A917F4Z4_9MICO|nr:OsmC family protein [Ornithinimicrobium tianjinense]GGF47149.1 osmotically inducible protein C [Ornithinimicrobium tianjinense]